MRLRLDLEYDGTDFAGWQVQPDARTVQAEVERALAVLWRTPVAVVGSGRTDAGVHASGQVAHVDVPGGTSLDADALRRLRRSLGGLLPKDVALLGLCPVAAAFHARFDAVRRTYHYRVATQERALERRTRVVLRPAPSFEAMNAAAAALVGRHPYDSFCRTQSETENRVCTVEEARWEMEERAGDWRFVVSADRFLHGMVRAMVGTLLQIGRGTRPADALPGILAARDRRAAGPAAPPHGLALVRVDYPGDASPGEASPGDATPAA